jgi:hypothetical protein
MAKAAVLPPVTGIQKFLRGLTQPPLLFNLKWSDWLEVDAPYETVNFTQKDVFARYNRNGYDWDIQAILYTPEREVDNGIAITMMHGGAGSSYGKDTTPDGRPGIARVLASQGFTVLNATYPGHYPPGGTWQESVADRNPWYLLDRKLPPEEIQDRNMKCTFNVIMQGFGQLVDENLAGRKILSYGHSTGGPMATMLHKWIKNATVIGIIGWGTGGPDGWRGEWRAKTRAEEERDRPIDKMARRSPDTFKAAGYESDPSLCPWGGGEGFTKWAEPIRSQMKSNLCDNQHMVNLDALEKYPPLTGLPREEYFDHLDDPDADWLKSISVILLVGEDDKGHWVQGKSIEDKREVFMGRKYEAAKVKNVHVCLVPKYGHYGIMELHNEKIAYCWLWAFKEGYFK